MSESSCFGDVVVRCWGLKGLGGLGGSLIHLPGGGASLLIGHDAEQPDRHPPGSVWSGSDASCRFGLATGSGASLEFQSLPD